MLQNAYSLAKIGADTAENERTFAENLPKMGNYRTGPTTLRAVQGRPGEGRGAALDPRGRARPSTAPRLRPLPSA